MLEYHNGILYCTPTDVETVASHSLTMLLHRGRKNGKQWRNIPNPAFNGKNARRLIEVASIPDEHRLAVMEKFKIATQDLATHLQQEVKSDSPQVIELMTEALANTLQAGEDLVLKDIEHYLTMHWQSFALHYVSSGLPNQSVLRYARVCALVERIWQSYSSIYQMMKDDDFRMYRRALLTNLLNAVQVGTLDLPIPRSEYRLGLWLDRVLSAYATSTPIYELVNVKNAGNKNRQRLTPEQANIANQLRIVGNAPTIAHVHAQLVAIARDRGWWRDKRGEFSAITLTTLQNHFRELDNQIALRREGTVRHSNTYVPTISRTLPTHINAMWGTDGSPLDLLIYQGGSARQTMNSVRVYDYASCRCLAIGVYHGGGEKAQYYILSIKEAIRNCGYKPKALQFDGGTASLELEKWCIQNDIIPMPARKGLARAKVIENLIYQFGKVLRTHPAWSGQNRTATGRNSQPSEEGFIQAQRNADTFARTEAWVKGEAIALWNDHIIETLEGKPCGQTPSQLWAEKESVTPQLEPLQLALLAGEHYRVRLRIDGLTIQKNNYTYTYFPNIFTEEGKQKGAEIFARTPLKHHPESGKLSLYLLGAGDAQAFIYDKDIEDGGKYLDTWILKPRVSMVAHQEGEAERLHQFLEFQDFIKSQAKETIAAASQFDVFTGEVMEETQPREKSKRHVVGTYDKERLHKEEMQEQSTTEKREPRTIDHPITGETMTY